MAIILWMEDYLQELAWSSAISSPTRLLLAVPSFARYGAPMVAESGIDFGSRLSGRTHEFLSSLPPAQPFPGVLPPGSPAASAFEVASFAMAAPNRKRVTFVDFLVSSAKGALGSDDDGQRIG